MRLYNTLSRQLEELPPPPGPIRMYFCGPTVYQRAHIGNARPFVLGMWVRAWLRQRGYDATLVHNITDVNDKIYDAAPGRQRGARSPRDGVVSAGHRRSRSRHAGRSSRRRRMRSHRSSASSGSSWTPATRTPWRAMSTSASRAIPDTAGSRASDPTRWRSRSRIPLKEDPRDFALWKANKPGRGHRLGLALGSRAAGLAHRVLGDGRGRVRAGVRDPRRRARPRLPASRERSSHSRSRSATSSRASGCTTEWSVAWAARRCRSRSATTCPCATCSTPGGARSRCCFFLGAHWRKPIEFGDEVLVQAQGAGRVVPQLLPRRTVRRRDGRGGARGRARRRARRRLQHARGARALPRVARSRRVGLAALGPRAVRSRRRSPRSRTRRRRSQSSPSSGARRAMPRTSRKRIACATRSPLRAGRCATSPSLPAIGSSAARDPGARLRTPPRARGAARAARGARALGERARGAQRVLAARGRAAAGADEARARPVGGCGNARPSGSRRVVRAVPVRRRVRARRRPGAASRLPRPGQRPAGTSAP